MSHHEQRTCNIQLIILDINIDHGQSELLCHGREMPDAAKAATTCHFVVVNVLFCLVDG